MEKGTGSIRFAFYREQLVLSFSLLGFDPTAQALQLPFNLTLEPYPVSDFLGGIRTQDHVRTLRICTTGEPLLRSLPLLFEIAPKFYFVPPQMHLFLHW